MEKEEKYYHFIYDKILIGLVVFITDFPFFSIFSNTVHNTIQTDYICNCLPQK